MQSVIAWSYQPDRCDATLTIIREDSTLSLVRQTASDSFLAIRNGLGWDETTEESDDPGIQSGGDGEERPRKVNKGQSFRLEMKTLN